MQLARKIARINETKNVCKKVYFGTKEAADGYVAKLQQSSKRDKVPVRSYLCPKCNCWHLTSWEAPDITKIIEELNAEIDRINAQNERMYAEDSKILADSMNTLVEQRNEIEKLRKEIFILKYGKK